jgi:wobble nucleotide-excising tRNase
MSQTLREIAGKLQASDKKVQLIYAFNGSGKTRLSREFKELISPKPAAETEGDEDHKSKVLYYNAFTEDLFYWDNDLEGDTERKLIIQPNSYTEWALKEQGQELNATKHFQRYTNSKLTPVFDPLFTEVRFTMESGSEETFGNIKISKGEESNFIWSVFFSVIEQVVSSLSEPEHDSAGQFDHLEYVFIDDPVSSLDENHLIQLAVDLATLIKSNRSDLKFVISTHNPLFFNVLSNELRNKDSDGNWKPKFHIKQLLERNSDDTFELREQASDTPFSYHLFLMKEIEHAIETGDVRKYHFGFMRNILEKTSTFLGYKRWEELLPKTSEGKTDPYANRLVNYGVHSKHSGEEIEPIPPEIKNTLKIIYEHFVTSGHTFKEAAQAQSGETAIAS